MLLGVFLFYANVATAQKNTVATGGEATGSGGTVSYSVGQIDYEQISGSSGTVTLGVQQPFEIFVLGVNDHPNIQIEMAVFPNPTRSNLTLRLGGLPNEGMHLILYDLMGRSIYKDRILSDETQIPMESLATSAYILRIVENNTLLKTFKIIKN